jgi:hypothetical protein
MNDYADRIAERIKGEWIADDNNLSSVTDLIAAGVREGYSTGWAAHG